MFFVCVCYAIIQTVIVMIVILGTETTFPNLYRVDSYFVGMEITSIAVLFKFQENN